MNALRRLILLTAVGLVPFSAHAADAPQAPAVSPAPALPPPVPGYPIGWCTLVRPASLEDAKASGFEYIELALQDVLSLNDEEFARIATQLRALPMPALTGYNPIPADMPLVGPSIDLALQNVQLTRVIERASALKLRTIILNAAKSWRIPEGFPRDQAVAQLTEFCTRFAKLAAARNLTVLVEPMRASDSNMIITIAEAIALVKAVDQPNFHFMVDYSFLTIQRDDPKALLASGDHLRHVHIANPAVTPRVYPMVRGESDYDAFFAVLKQIDYRGGISVHAGTKDFAGEAPRAIAFLRSMAAELAAAKK